MQYKTTIKALADFVAAAVVMSLVLFAGLAITGLFGASLGAVGATWFGLYAFIVLMSATKLYGKKIYDSVKGLGKGFLQMSQQNQPVAPAEAQQNTQESPAENSNQNGDNN